MLKKMNENEAKNKILDAVKDYCDMFHNSEKPFVEGDRINYAGRVYDYEEMVNLVDASLEYWLTSGRYTEEFERNFAAFLEIKNCTLVNSGSSANLLALSALTSPLLKNRRINRGDEVITVAASFPTTVTPIIQLGFVPVFVDITIPEYNINVDMLESACSEKTKAVMVAHTLGNPMDMQRIKDFCEKHNLWMIEDNCDALGSEIEVDGKMRYTGTIGDIGTSSFYPAHHITMGEGGAVYTDNELLNTVVRSMRDWGRACSCAPGQDNKCGHRFDKVYGDLPPGYDHKYTYSHFGYNLKATDMQAAIGCAQLKKLPLFIEKRRENFNNLYDGLKSCEPKLILPKIVKETKPSWFGFPITCNNEVDRDDMVSYLEEKGIQTRPLFAGNIIRHPCFDELRNGGTGYRVEGSLINTDRVMRDSFWIGVYPGMTYDKIRYMIDTINGYFE